MVTRRDRTTADRTRLDTICDGPSVADDLAVQWMVRTGSTTMGAHAANLDSYADNPASQHLPAAGSTPVPPRWKPAPDQAGLVESPTPKGAARIIHGKQQCSDQHEQVLAALRRALDDLKAATLEWVDWFDHRGLRGEIGTVPPAEHETAPTVRSSQPNQPKPVTSLRKRGGGSHTFWQGKRGGDGRAGGVTTALLPTWVAQVPRFEGGIMGLLNRVMGMVRGGGTTTGTTGTGRGTSAQGRRSRRSDPAGMAGDVVGREVRRRFGRRRP